MGATGLVSLVLGWEVPFSEGGSTHGRGACAKLGAAVARMPATRAAPVSQRNFVVMKASLV
jgi:hypothetical protein